MRLDDALTVSSCSTKIDFGRNLTPYLRTDHLRLETESEAWQTMAESIRRVYHDTLRVVPTMCQTVSGDEVWMSAKPRHA